jgi:rRNA maturation RNase YbeY
MNKIQFFNNNTKFTLGERTRLKAYIRQLFKKHKTSLDALTYIFCSDEYLLAINQQFLKHDFYTDIISFDISAANNAVTGEIYISIDRVRENAKIHNASFKEELHRVIFHGALHLCGFKDKSVKHQKEMRRQENLALSFYFG